jgi:hypothetical protein
VYIKTFSGVAVNRYEYSQLAPVKQVICNIVHATVLVYVQRQLLRLSKLNCFIAILPKLTALLPMQPVYALMVASKAFTPEHDMNSPVTVMNASLRNFFHLHDQSRVVACIGFV